MVAVVGIGVVLGARQLVGPTLQVEQDTVADDFDFFAEQLVDCAFVSCAALALLVDLLNKWVCFPFSADEAEEVV